MCDLPRAYSETWRTARRAHRCCECPRTIAPGERYQYVSGIWDEPADFKTCAACAELRRLLSEAIRRGDVYGDDECGVPLGGLEEACWEAWNDYVAGRRHERDTRTGDPDGELMEVPRG